MLRLIAGLLGIWALTSQAATLPGELNGPVIKVHIADVRPTQAVLGYREIDYKVNRYRNDVKKGLDEYCQISGMGSLKSADSDATIANSQSFHCTSAPGSDLSAMKTAVIGPDNQVYLTDGHHTLVSLAELASDALPVYLHVSADYRNLPSMQAFWDKMQQMHWVYLNGLSEPISVAQLPQHMVRNAFSDDAYRSLVYFTKGIGYVTRSDAPPFLEFYWGQWLKSRLPLTQAALNDKNQYAELVENAARLMSSNDADAVLVNGLTAGKLGALARFNKKAYHKLISARGKLAFAFM